MFNKIKESKLVSEMTLHPNKINGYSQPSSGLSVVVL